MKDNQAYMSIIHCQQFSITKSTEKYDWYVYSLLLQALVYLEEPESTDLRTVRTENKFLVNWTSAERRVIGA